MSAGPRCPGKEWLFQRQECLEAPYWCCPRGKTNPTLAPKETRD